MAAPIEYSELRPDSGAYRLILALLALLAAIGLGAAWHMETEGHHVTGMNNQVVWGMPHVFAILLIVAASGALNTASMASVFERVAYKPLARFSALLAVALLVGGLAILVLDLGRPDRLIVAMTHYNFKSIFAWNILLYVGFIAIVAAYLWLMMERRMQRFSKPAGLLALVWRLVLTTGTGSIFGFLVARQAYDSAILAPLFVVMSFALGLAVTIPLLMLTFRLDRRELDDALLGRLGRLLAIFVAGLFYFVLVYHLTKLYGTRHHGYEAFLLRDGGIYTFLFWAVQLGLGNALPLALLLLPAWRGSRRALTWACGLVLLGGLAQLYVIIIGGQAWPLDIFPGYRVESAFFDGALASYSPSAWEILLGIGGITMALLITLLGLRVLPIMPRALAAGGRP